MVEREACFLSICLSLILHRVRSKMTSYSKTATTIYLYDVPRSIAEDPRIAFLQSNNFWQVSCAKSKTKACTEISAWTRKLDTPFHGIIAIDTVKEILTSISFKQKLAVV